MSRALDAHVKAALKQGDHARIYKDISSALCQIRPEGLLEIAILGSEYATATDQNVLVRENSVGVPKIRLVQAFFVARGILMGGHEQQQQQHPGRTGVDGARNAEFEAATAVALLMDPEHLTAANLRKRLVVAAAASGRAQETLSRERYFVDSLLTSPLHRHTKSPTLWSHRRWLLVAQERAGGDVSSGDSGDSSGLGMDLRTNLRTDLKDVVMVAGARHPQNYYAWTHARWLVKRAAGMEAGKEKEREKGNETEKQPDMWTTETMPQVATAVHKWCHRNPGDISGWTFLLHVLDACEGGTAGATSASVLRRTKEAAEVFGWARESVVWFVETLEARLRT